MIAVEGFSHIGIVVPDLEAAAALFAERFGLEVGAPIEVPAQRLRLAYVTVGAFKIELLTPTAADSPIAKFLERNPRGGVHHVALAVADAGAAAAASRDSGLQILGDGPAAGHHGRPLFFLHPKDLLGTLFEIEQGEPTPESRNEAIRSPQDR